MQNRLGESYYGLRCGQVRSPYAQKNRLHVARGVLLKRVQCSKGGQLAPPS